MRPSGVTQQGRTLDEIGPHLRRLPVSGQVHGHHLVVTGHVVGQSAPEPPGLGEAVGQHQTGPLTTGLGVQGECRHKGWR